MYRVMIIVSFVLIYIIKRRIDKHNVSLFGQNKDFNDYYFSDSVNQIYQSLLLHLR